MARILAISNQKGGVGKTTTAINLSAALAGGGQRVLLVDLDPQGNATSGLGVNPRTVAGGVYDVLLDVADAQSTVVETCIEGLHLLPADPNLVGAELELVGALGRERRLRRALDAVRDGYDWILCDCPPSLGILTVNGLVAADGVLVPVQAEYYALEGLAALMSTIAAVRRHLNPDLVRDGILITLSDARTNLCREVEAQARAHFGDEVYRTVIPRTIRLGEAPSHGRPLVEYMPESRGAQAYLALAGEMLGGPQLAREAS